MYLRFFMPDGYGRLLRELNARFCRKVTGSLSVVFRYDSFGNLWDPGGTDQNEAEKGCFPAGSIRIRRPERPSWDQRREPYLCYTQEGKSETSVFNYFTLLQTLSEVNEVSPFPPWLHNIYIEKIQKHDMTSA